MLDRITRAGIASRLAIAGFVEDRFERAKSDRGQGSVEYVGIIIVVVMIVTAVVAAATPVGNAIKTALIDAVGKISELGG